MKIACFLHPHIGGTFSLYRQLRSHLAPSGIQLLWLGIGNAAHAAADDPAWAHEREHGYVVGKPGQSDADQAAALLRALKAGRFDAVMVNVQADRVHMNAARYMPSDLLRIMVVHNITPGTYAAAKDLRDYVHATVAVSRRIGDDLLRFGFRPDWTTVIPNATEGIAGVTRPKRDARQPLRLLSLGRVEDASKGVFWLPQIMAKLPCEVTLTIAGDGPDLARLRKLAAPLGDRIRFLGSVAPEVAKGLLLSHDVLLAPSRFEGLPMAMLEAMAAGCVPVATRLRGVTDMLIEEGRNGLMFPAGDIAAAVLAIEALARSPLLLEGMSGEAMKAARGQFSVGVMAGAYASLFRRLADDPPSIEFPIPLQDWSMPRGMRDGLRTALPLPIKNVLRNMRERFAS